MKEKGIPDIGHWSDRHPGWWEKYIHKDNILRVPVPSFTFSARSLLDNHVFTVTRTYMTTDTEVKISISDMQREIGTKNFKHRRFIENNPNIWAAPFTHYFYFAVPAEIEDKATKVLNERYPYAGLLVFTDGDIDIYNPTNITMVKRSKRFKRKPVDMKELLELGYQSTNTAIKYARWLINGVNNS